MWLVVGFMFLVDVRRDSKRPRGESSSSTMDSYVHSLAGWNGLRVLLRIIHPVVTRSSKARRAVVLEELK